MEESTMNLFKRQPLATSSHLPLFSQLSDEMNHFFDQDFGSLGKNWGTLSGNWQPAIDIEKKDKKYIIRADVPGVKSKDIKVTMENGMLTIEGKRETKVEENKENYHCIERNYGNFYRAVGLPDAVNSDKIEAHNRNGVLEIIVPKSASSEQKMIQVHDD
jgi:HSP20 family protein